MLDTRQLHQTGQNDSFYDPGSTITPLEKNREKKNQEELIPNHYLLVFVVFLLYGQRYHI